MDSLLQAAQPLLAPAFTLGAVAFTWLELLACVLAVAMVVLNMRVHPGAWPLAIASSLLYFLLFWNSRLYGDATLQLFFVAVAGWGWWQWLRGRRADGSLLQVRSLSPRGRALAVATLLLAWPATALWLRHATDTDVPWWDAFPTAASLIGQWLLGRKFVENWAVWLVVNVVATALYAYKGLWLTVGLYAVFVAMSAAGWRAWQRQAVPAA